MNKFNSLSKSDKMDIGVALENIDRFNLLIFFNNENKPLSFDEIIERFYNHDEKLCTKWLNALLKVRLVGHTYPGGYHITPLGRDTLEFFLGEE